MFVCGQSEGVGEAAVSESIIIPFLSPGQGELLNTFLKDCGVILLEFREIHSNIRISA